MPGKLSAYHAKRDFRVTAEPRGRVEHDHEELRFVVQKHDASTLHYDFRLELAGTLKSWAIPKGPSLDPTEKRLAVQVEDHPLAYADFEGRIPEHQYGAGTVEIWDSGYWEPDGDPVAGYRDGKLKFELHGGRLRGSWTLIRTHMRGGKQMQWLLIKSRDEAARPGDAEEAAHAREAAPVRKPKAAKGGMHPPDAMPAQLAVLAEAPPAEGNWIYEIKYDGYRILARIDGGDVRLHTRDGKDWTAKLPKQVEALKALKLENAWLDGEIVVLDESGIPSFQKLQNAFDEKSDAEIVYFLFDLPFLDGQDLRSLPLSERHARLAALLDDADNAALRYSAPLPAHPDQLLQSVCKLSMEGIIGKRADSPYSGKRSGDWIKLKCRQRQEFVIAGYTDPQGARQRFGSLVLGVHTDDGRLRYAGRVGTGFDARLLESVHKRLAPLETRDCPFPKEPPRTGRAHIHWVKPQLVAEVSFVEWTTEGMVRQAVFHGLRMDKPASQVTQERAAPIGRPMPSQNAKEDAAGIALHGVVITHPERVIDAGSGLTKLDLARYYDSVAETMLPYLKGRPVYLLRHPSGIDAKGFFQRHAVRTAIPGLTVLDPEVDPEHQPLMVIASHEALLSAAQMGTIELHTCNATADLIDKPDSLILDLDPDPRLHWKEVVKAARIVRALLEELGLPVFVKTSGSKGLHLAVPLARRHEWDAVAEFAKAVTLQLARTHPLCFSATMGETHRVGKIFIDYLRNQKMASTVAPYSARAKKGLPVSTPIAWEELDELSGSQAWTIASLPGRLTHLKHDPWADFRDSRGTITKDMLLALGRRF